MWLIILILFFESSARNLNEDCPEYAKANGICIKCKDNRKIDIDDPKEDCTKFDNEDDYFFIDYDYQVVKKFTNENRCEDGLFWYVVDENNYEYKCTEERSCSSAGEKQLIYKDNCVKKCPISCFQDHEWCVDKNDVDCESYLCNEKERKSFSKILMVSTKSTDKGYLEKNYFTTTSLLYFKKYKKDIIKTFISEPSSSYAIKGTEFSFYFYRSDLTRSSPPRVDMSTLEKEIKKSYPDEDLFIAITESCPCNGSDLENIEFEIYRGNEEKVDLTPYKDNKILIQKRLDSQAERLNIKLGKELIKDGIDIYNKSDPFYNDVCVTFSVDGKDYTLQNRRDKIYKEVAFCDDGCNMTRIDLENTFVECACPPDFNSEEYELDSIIESKFSEIKDFLNTTNYKMFKCYKIPFTSNISKNYGHWIIVSITVPMIVGTVLFWKEHFTRIKAIIFDNFPMFSPAKRHKKNNAYESEAPKSKEVSSLRKPDSSRPSSSREFISTKKKPKIEISSKKKDDYEFIPDEELNEMCYFKAKKEDKRKFYQYYFSILSEKEVNLSTILTKSMLFRGSLKLLMFCFSISTFFFLSALFCNKDYITRRTNTKEKITFSYIIKHETSTSVYASFTGFFIGKLVQLFKDTGDTLMKIMKRRKDPKLKERLTRLYFKMRLKLIFITILIFFLMFLYWYFLTIFCEIYKHNQLQLIMSTSITLFLSVVIQGFICFIIASFRFMSFCLNKNFLFLISSCINELL